MPFPAGVGDDDVAIEVARPEDVLETGGQLFVEWPGTEASLLSREVVAGGVEVQRPEVRAEHSRAHEQARRDRNGCK